MKIRISDQSLRIRLSTDEAMALEKGAIITSTLRLNTIDVFAVELKTWHLTIGEVHSGQNKLIVSIPQDAAEKLVREPQFIFLSEQGAETQTPLSLEVEIDLQKVK
jgi:hypothetical protein